ncbi:MAG: hypothetical protein SGJ27_06560 [Candidatus Melainabacteria bacterium]|nr:hypothetical protein [Candidatus Melainabacteria bacterium]
MGSDQADQPKNGKTGTTLESPDTKPADTDSVHSIFISDFLTDSAPKRAQEAPAAVTTAPKVADANPLFREPVKTLAPRTMEAPSFAPPIQGFNIQSFAPPEEARPADNRMAAPVYAAQSNGLRGADRSLSASAQSGAPTENFYGMTPQGPAPGDMTYRAMSRSQRMAQVAQIGDQMANGGPPAEGGRRRFFQPHRPVINQPQDGRRPEGPGVPQEQPRQRLFGKPLFRGQGDAPAAPKNEPMQKVEFKAPNETGIIKEMALPAKFKEVPKDPNLAPGEDPIRREYAAGNSRISLYEGRVLSAEEQASLKAVLAKQGPLTENMNGYEDALMMMGSGYFNFFNNPQVAVGKFQGRDALILSDEDPATKTVGQTIFVRSDKDQYLYAINFQGAKADFPAVKKGFDTIKWRPTPDAVTPPAPGPKR